MNGSAEDCTDSSLSPTALTTRQMSAVKRTDTRPELALRSSLHRAGLRYRKDFRVVLSGITVRPDVVFTRRRVAVFLDGCYWHGCPDHCRRPRKNSEFWANKINGNMQRDLRQTASLERSGWIVVRVWEHQPVHEATEAVINALALANHGK